MTEFVSSLSSFNTLINTITDSRVNLDRVGQQVSTGKVSPDLADISRRAELLDLRETRVQTDGYTNAISISQTKANALDASITRVITAAQTVIDAIDQFNPNSPSPKLNFIASAVTNATNDIGAALNTRSGNTYVFSGSRYGTQPVNVANMSASAATLAAAPYNAAPPASISALGTSYVVTANGGAAYPVVNVAAAPHSVPDYDANYTAATANDDPNQLAFTKQGVTVEDQRRVTYGITSNDPVFQDLITSLRAAQNGSSTAPAPPQPANWLQLARTGIQNAITALQAKQATLGATRADMQATLDRHNVDASNLDINISKITDADAAKASTDLLSIQSQFQGSLTVTKTLLGLSLVNYLK